MSKKATFHARAPETATVSRSTGRIGIDSAYQPRTDLGRQLWSLRRQIVASGEPLLDEDQIEEELDRRRGGA